MFWSAHVRIRGGYIVLSPLWRYVVYKVMKWVTSTKINPVHIQSRTRECLKSSYVPGMNPPIVGTIRVHVRVSSRHWFCKRAANSVNPCSLCHRKLKKDWNIVNRRTGNETLWTSVRRTRKKITSLHLCSRVLAYQTKVINFKNNLTKIHGRSIFSNDFSIRTLSCNTCS